MILADDPRFAQALDECCARVRRGEPLARCLADYPAAYHAELARLVPVAGQVDTLRADPAPAFRARLEGQLLAAVDAAKAAERARSRARGLGFLRRLPLLRAAILALVAVLVLAGSGAGMVAAAEDSLPDSPLYNVKAAREWVDLLLARSAESKVNVYTNHLAARARELALAVRNDKPQPVVEALARRLGAAVDDMVDKAVELRGQGRPLPAVRALVALRALEREAERLQSRAAPEVKASLARLVTDLEEQAKRLEPRVGL